MKSTDKSLHDILAQFREDARNNRDLGDRFERMIQQFLRVDPLYAALFSEVWLWNEWPDNGPRFALIVHHTDGDREVAYDRTSRIGKLDKALDETVTKGWTVMEMQKDWNVVFPGK